MHTTFRAPCDKYNGNTPHPPHSTREVPYHIWTFPSVKFYQFSVIKTYQKHINTPCLAALARVNIPTGMHPSEQNIGWVTLVCETYLYLLGWK